MKVLITEAVHATLAEYEGITMEERDGLWRSPPDLLAAVGDAEGLIVRNETRVDRKLIAAAPRLRVVGRLGAGLDNLDVAALNERAIELVHGGGLNARAVAEYAVGACLDLARGLSRGDRGVRAGEWRRTPGRELHGQVLGVIGLGATGAATARLALAMGMLVIGHDPYVEAPKGVRRTGLDELLGGSRFVSIHVPLTAATRGLIGSSELKRLRPGAYLVNAARGGVVDEAALLQALQAGALGGAALDVREAEPPAAGDALSRRDDVLNTPHIAGMTEEAQQAIAAHVMAGVARTLGAGRG